MYLNISQISILILLIYDINCLYGYINKFHCKLRKKYHCNNEKNDDNIKKSKKTKKSIEQLNDNKLTLVIVESPSKSKTIQKFVDSDKYIIDYCAGHIRDFPDAADVPQSLKKKIIIPNINVNIGTLGVDVYNNFQPIYEPKKDKLEIINRLKKLSKSVDQILLATDEDREGEAISWHLIEVLNPKIPFKRAVFNEITQNAIIESFNNPRDIDMNLVLSQETRKILDRLVGYTMSPMLWRYIVPGLSAGRVQSCALKLITDRERKRWDFVPSKYFSIDVTLATNNTIAYHSNEILSTKLHLINSKRIANEKDFDGNTGELKDNHKDIIIVSYNHSIYNISNIINWFNEPINIIINDINVKTIHRKPPHPFITSSLQQESSKKLGFSPYYTMKLAQQLYENGFITYMRTDSIYLSASSISVIEKIVNSIFGNSYFSIDSKNKFLNNKFENNKNAQEAHEAIRPTIASNGFFKSPNDCNISDDLLVLYSLIYKRTIASLMSSSETIATTYTIKATNNLTTNNINEAILKKSVSYIQFPGYLAVNSIDQFDRYVDTISSSSNIYSNLYVGQKLYLHDKIVSKLIEKHVDKDTILIDNDDITDDDKEVSINTSIVSNGILAYQHITRPPSRFSEASFIKELEDIGVGRPSTYSYILQVLKDREYILIDKHSLIPTVTGMMVSKLLENHFSDLVDTNFTACLEESLDNIANGLLEKNKFLNDFYFGNNNSQLVDPRSTLQSSNLNITNGLYHTVINKLINNDIDHLKSRSLQLPYFDNDTSIHFYRKSIYICRNYTTVDSNNQTIYEMNRWKCPIDMMSDIRTFTKQNIIKLTSSINTNGIYLGSYHNQSIYMKLSKYGKYIQLGNDTKKSYHSIPNYIKESNLSYEDIVFFIHLPKIIGSFLYQSKNLTVQLNCNQKGFYLSILQYPKLFHLSDDINIHNLTLNQSIELIGDINDVLNSYRNIGIYNNSSVIVSYGKYGYYIRHDDIIVSIPKSVNPLNITIDRCIELIELKKLKPKRNKWNKKASKSKKSVNVKSISKIDNPVDSNIDNDVNKKTKKTNGYILYCKEAVENGMTYQTAIKAWKTLDSKIQLDYKNKALTLI